jgi:predicted GIY-YIG superfamily endonuclease
MGRCADNSLYTGITLKLEKRFQKHNAGKGAKYTRSRLPMILAWWQQVETKSKALKLEARIKRLSKVKKEELVHLFGPGKYLAEFRTLGAKIPNLMSRSTLVQKYSWAVPNEEAIRTLCDLNPIVEMGAGTGYWASLVHEYGGDIIAYDRQPPNVRVPGQLTINPWHAGKHVFSPVLPGQPEILTQYGDTTLLLSWPPSNCTMASDCLKNWHGEFLIHIGERETSGDDEFYEILQKQFRIVRRVNIPRFLNLHDEMRVYQRKA